MSKCYRAVIEQWSNTTSNVPGDFSAEEVFDVISEVADNAGTTASSVEYSDNLSVWVASGVAFLDFVSSLPTDKEAAIAIYGDIDSPETDDAVFQILQDLRNNADEWRKSIDYEGAGCLRFYIDE